MPSVYPICGVGGRRFYWVVKTTRTGRRAEQYWSAGEVVLVTNRNQ